MSAHTEFSPPPFRPTPLAPGGHAQTLAGYWWPAEPVVYRATQHIVGLADGDKIVLHDDLPETWQDGHRVALLVHGLGGCHGSGYMQRMVARLNEQGVRTFRMDMRGCGAGLGLAQHLPHSGRTADVAAALGRIAELAPRSPVTAVGMSLGGNLVLNLLAEVDAWQVRNLVAGMAICPPVDLVACSQQLRAQRGRLYDRFFIHVLLKQLKNRRDLLPEAQHILLRRRPASIWEFDEAVTAPLSGFTSAQQYYQQTSPGPRLAAIRIPTLILAAADDPLVPPAPFSNYPLSPAITLHLSKGGGHLGFIARRGFDRDCRWLDWRVVDWVTKP